MLERGSLPGNERKRVPRNGDSCNNSDSWDNGDYLDCVEFVGLVQEFPTSDRENGKVEEMSRLTHNGTKEAKNDVTIMEVIAKLEMYEDIGLDPEQVQQLKEMNTPIRPELEADGYADGELVYDTWICPNCKTSYEVDYDRYFYCPNCGQKIEWSEE